MRNGLIFLLLIAFFVCEAQTKHEKGKSKKSVKGITSEDHTPEQSRNERIFIDAERMKMLGQYQGATDLFEECVKLDPNNSAAMFELARLYYSSKQDDKALLNISAAVKLTPDNLWYNLVYAQVLVAKEMDKEAINVYDKILKLEPHEISYYYDKAQLFERTGQIDDAIEEYDLIEKIFGLDEYNIEQKKRLYLSLKKVDKAVVEVQKLINDNPANPDYLNMMAEIYMTNNMTDKATEIYKTILDKFPNYPYALLALADVAYQNGDRNLAIDYTLKAFASQEMNIDSKIKILYQYIQFADSKKSEMNDAYKLANALISVYPNEAKSYAITGDLYHVNGEDSIALVHYEKSLTLEKQVFSVWQQLFFILSDLRYYNKMKSYSEEAMELFPSQALPFFFNGVANDNMMIYDTAIRSFEKAYKLTSDNKALRAQILASLGDTYHNLKINKSSDSCYEASIKLDPTNAYAMNNYSYYLSLRNEFLEKAKEYSAMSNNIDKTNASYMDTYAWILYQLKEYRSAKEWQEKALRNGDQSDPVMFDHYGDILFQLGDIDNAVKSWIKAKEKGSDSKLLDKKIATKKLYE